MPIQNIIEFFLVFPITRIPSRRGKHNDRLARVPTSGRAEMQGVNLAVLKDRDYLHDDGIRRIGEVRESAYLHIFRVAMSSSFAPE